MLQLTSSAAAILVVLVSVLGIALVLGASHLNIAGFLKISAPDTAHEANRCVLVLGLSLLVGMPLQLAQSVQHGLQQGYLATLWTTCANLVALIALLWATAQRAGLVPLVFAIACAPLAVAVANTVWYFSRVRPDIRPRLSAVDPKLSLKLLRTGLLFVVLQLAVAFGFSSDNVVVGATLGAVSVPALGVPTKLFSIVQQFLAMITVPLWPAFGEAAARGDIVWVRQTLRRAHLFSLGIAAIASAILVWLGPWAVQLWSQGQIHTSIAILLPLAIWTVVAAWGNSVAAFLNGTGEISVQATSGVLMAASAFALKWVLIGPLGLGGVVWATVIAFGVFSIFPIVWGQRRALRKIEFLNGRSG